MHCRLIQQLTGRNNDRKWKIPFIFRLQVIYSGFEILAHQNKTKSTG